MRSLVLKSLPGRKTKQKLARSRRASKEYTRYLSSPALSWTCGICGEYLGSYYDVQPHLDEHRRNA